MLKKPEKGLWLEHREAGGRGVCGMVQDPDGELKNRKALTDLDKRRQISPFVFHNDHSGFWQCRLEGSRSESTETSEGGQGLEPEQWQQTWTLEAQLIGSEDQLDVGFVGKERARTTACLLA